MLGLQKREKSDSWTLKDVQATYENLSAATNRTLTGLALDLYFLKILFRSKRYQTNDLSDHCTKQFASICKKTGIKNKYFFEEMKNIRIKNGRNVDRGRWFAARCTFFSTLT